MSEFSPNNPVVKRCLQGLGMEENGKPDEASKLFFQAWTDAESSFEKFIAAHYVARHQKTVSDRLKWLEIIPEFLNQFAGNFTRPAFKCFVRLMKGFLEVPGSKAITELNREKPPQEHFSAIYDFLNRYSWLSQDLADTLLTWLLIKAQPVHFWLLMSSAL